MRQVDIFQQNTVSICLTIYYGYGLWSHLVPCVTIQTGKVWNFAKYLMKIVFTFFLFFILSAGGFLIAEEGLEKEPLAGGSGNQDGPLFDLLAPEKTGIKHVNPILPDHPLARVYHSSSACGGISIGDINLDGKLDIFAGSGPNPNSLYLGKPDGNGLEFTNVAEEMGVAGEALDWAVGTAMIDIDNDGDLDIYVCNYDKANQLFINQIISDGKPGKFGFIEKAKEFGIDVVDGSVMPSFADYDCDGDLDLYILTHQIYREDGRPAEPIEIIEENGKFFVGEEWQRWFVLQKKRGDQGQFLYTEIGRPDYLFRNDGGKFTQVNEEAGISTDAHWGNSATWWDFNHDGWPDLYVGNDFKSPDFMYRNNGDGTFTEISKETLRHTTWFSMGAVQTDLNNDGWTDFVLADMLPSSHYMQKASMGSMGSRLENLKDVGGATQQMRNAVYINTGTDQYLEGAWLTGMSMTEWTWAIRSQDFDNDGLMDVFFTNGIPRQFNHSDLPSLEHEDLVGRPHWSHYKNTPMRREQNLVFHNNGEFQFDDASKRWGLDHLGISYGASTADFDGDGRLELLVANLVDPLSFYHNTGTEGNRVVFELLGTQSNKNGIGASITMKAGGRQMVRQLFPSGGYLDGDDSIVQFGLGTAEKIDTVTVIWPSGQEQNFRDLEVNHRYTVTEPEGEAKKSGAVKSRAPKSPMFTASKALKGFKHSEVPFDDYARQPLLPYKLSQLGPGQAWGDIDGDGDPDFYLGGAAGQSGQLFKNNTKPGSEEIELVPVPVFIFTEDARFEDMGCLFLDIDGDGDLDLYVGSGGVESNPQGPDLVDRLFLNDGTGDFKRASQSALPDVRESTSIVAAVDFDHDGDLDIFTGARSVPGQYPSPPKNTLYRNNGGVFENVTDTIAPDLAGAGMVTSALWSDVDSDGWTDLLVTCDWGPVKLFRNRGGKSFEQASDEETGFVNLTGWFNGINGGDIDNDGDIDYVVTNLGRNTQYQASAEKPELIFFGDFEGNGKSNIVEAMFENVNGKIVCYPRRGKSCSTNAMPSLSRIPTYDLFAKSTLPQLYGINSLQKSLLLKATNLDSLVMINSGDGKFQVSPMPHLAQISPGYGVSLTDVDLDGKTDCYIVQNFFTPQEETGDFDSGLSLLLRGTGDSKKPFDPVWPGESGLEIPGDAKSLSAVDVNLDGKNDFVIGMNDDEPIVYLNRIENAKTHPLRIRLGGQKGNPRSIGARVTVMVSGIATQTAEIYAGGSYLSQVNTDLIFAIPKVSTSKKVKVQVRWPDGVKSEIEASLGSQFLNLSRN